MTHIKPVTWLLHGDVNSSEFKLEGHGTADLSTGETVLNLTAQPALPGGFDPALSQRICNFALAAYAAPGTVGISIRDAVEAELIIKPRRFVSVFDAGGEQLVRLEALTTMQISPDAIVVTNWLSGFSHLPGPVVAVTGSEQLHPTDLGRAVGVSSFHVELEGGVELEGLTVVPYRFDRPVKVSPAVRSITSEACEWTSATSLTLRAVSQWHDLPITVDSQQA